MSFNSVTVVGAGPVGCAIAVAIARVGVPVSIVRGARGEIGLATARIERRLRWHVDGGHLEPADRDRVRARIDLGTDLGVAAASDLVLETTFGDGRSRRALLATIERSLSPGAVLATNSEPDLLSAMAEVVRRRDQFVAMRFTHPATQSSVVEFAFLSETAPGVMGACRTFCAWLEKTAVVTSEAAPRVGYREFLLGSA
jgi:3-hydroxyacyl-CoA dehydrogenase